MTKQEQLVEMTQIICGHCLDGICLICGTSCTRDCSDESLDEAEALYTAGYRKIDDNCAVITKDDLEQLSRDYVVKAYDKLRAENAKLKKQVKEVRKETAKEILTMLHLICGEDSDDLNADDWNKGWNVAMRYACETISNKFNLEVINDERCKIIETKKN